tara:strand:+ start:887 stop:1456 length:570 start_codon:yes stop_codon:yes gene_type:complete
MDKILKLHVSEFYNLCICLKRIGIQLPKDVKMIIFDDIEPRFSLTSYNDINVKKFIENTSVIMKIPKIKEYPGSIQIISIVHSILGILNIKITHKNCTLFSTTIDPICREVLLSPKKFKPIPFLDTSCIITHELISVNMRKGMMLFLKEEKNDEIEIKYQFDWIPETKCSDLFDGSVKITLDNEDFDLM